ncbi:MAG: hypothetical protein QM698_03170 [Micropepsaceae bacterium]
MKIFLAIGALLAFAIGALGLSSLRSDIQIIVAAVGIFSGFILAGLFAVIDKLDRLLAREP